LATHFELADHDLRNRATWSFKNGANAVVGSGIGRRIQFILLDLNGADIGVDTWQAEGDFEQGNEQLAGTGSLRAKTMICALVIHDDYQIRKTDLKDSLLQWLRRKMISSR